MTIPLRLTQMHERHGGLTRSVASYFHEALRVCLDRHHVSPINLQVEVEGEASACRARWRPTDDATRRAWANETDTTEAGAYGCVIAAVEAAIELLAVRRAEQGTGADYYIGPPGAGVEDLEDCYRLEVSGVDTGTRETVEQRLARKLEQARRGNSNIPALAGVVGFRERLVLLERIEGSP